MNAVSLIATTVVYNIDYLSFPDNKQYLIANKSSTGMARSGDPRSAYIYSKNFQFSHLSSFTNSKHPNHSFLQGVQLWS